MTMRTRIFFFSLFFFACIFNNYGQLIPNPKNTHILIVGVLEWENGLNSFSKTNRKDAELEAFFINMGIPKSNIKTLYDSQASVSNILKELKTISTNADKESTIIFYYAGHGVQESGKIFFANYDIVTNNCKSTGFDLNQLNLILSKSLAERILLFADCCYSGGLISECNKLGKSGKKILALSSATASNTSTGNWTFTQTLLDCLNGNKLADTNNDNIIQLSELKKEVFDAMKYRERQMAGFAVSGIAMDTKISAINSNSTSCKGSKICRSYFWAKNDNSWKPVRIIEDIGNNKYKSEFYFYSDKNQEQLSKNQLRKMHFVKHSLNEKVKVEWEKKWYKAKIINTKDDFYLIKYDGYEDSWNEWVMYDRIRTGKEQQIQVEDGGSYYPAVVLEQKDAKYYIHYKDYDYTWDEWVGSERIKN